MSFQTKICDQNFGQRSIYLFYLFIFIFQKNNENFHALVESHAGGDEKHEINCSWP